MKMISIKELQSNIDDYIVFGQEEELEIVDNGKVLFYITPERIRLMNKVESLFGSLPREAYNDDDIDRE